MRTKKRLSLGTFAFGLSAVLAAAGWVLLGGGTASSMIHAIGGPRLVAVQPLPEMNADGPMCNVQPAAASQELMALLQSPAAGSSDAADLGARNLIRDRPPERVIKDPYPTYSAVAMDFNHDEIVLLDENLFQIMSYDRTANTPPSASMTEPKRVIGGHETEVEFNCGLYVDQKTGDIYAVNNDTLDKMVVFNREAKGNVPPTRELNTPHRTYGIAVDEAAEELYMTVQDPPEIVVYNKYASGRDQPKRVIRGNKTLLADAHGMGIDTKNGWMFVANYGNGAKYAEPGQGRGNGEAGGGGGFGGYGAARVPGSGYFAPPAITVYPLKSEGDVAPIRVIQGPKTKLNWPAQMFVDPDRGDVYVANDGGNDILVFHETDEGDVAPYRTIGGSKSSIKNPTAIYVDPIHKELVVSNMGNHSASVYPLDANGDVAPLRVIRSAPLDTPALQIGNPGAVAYDTKREEILVPN
jgi:DNA-binding beta-propeller fold protein YncE